MPGLTTLSRGFDHLGEIARTLADLQGTETVAYELVQNADDATGATRMRFRLRDDGLEVWNDGVFTRCTDITAEECEDLTLKGHRCDFHSLRSIASGDKRSRHGVTGKFGIGFTAVYQLTDHPELFSAGEHWRFDESAPEADRIQREAPDNPGPGTTFWLPWAKELTEFRRRIRQEVISEDRVGEISATLMATVPIAMPFLKHLESIEVVTPTEHRTLTRRYLPERVAITSTDRESWSWVILRGNFADRANELRSDHPDVLEVGRSSDVVVAFPLDHAAGTGKLYASLPTEESSHLPFLINAEFYPASDRKRVRFEQSPESEFNRAAISAAGAVLADRLELLPRLVGDLSFVRMLITARDVWQNDSQGEVDPCFGEIWEDLRRAVVDAHVLPVASGGYASPGFARLWRDEAELQAAAVLAELEVVLVRPDVNSEWYRLTDVGVRELTLNHVVTALSSLTMPTVGNPVTRPSPLSTETGRRQLWAVLELLLATPNRASAAARDALRQCAIAPTVGGAFSPWSQVYVTDPSTSGMLADTGLTFDYLDQNRIGEGHQQLISLALRVEASLVLERLEAAHRTGNLRKDFDSIRLLTWFERHQDELDAPQLTRIQWLPIFPTAEGLRKLPDLVLPGNFKDPLGLATVAAVDAGSTLGHFLRKLGAKSLTLSTYCQDLVPPAVQSGHLSDQQLHELVRLLAERSSELRDDDAVRDALSTLPLVACTDGAWRRPTEVYVGTSVRKILGNNAPLAELPPDRQQSYESLYTWLGATNEPRPGDVIGRSQSFVAGPWRYVPQIEAIVGYLGKKYSSDPASVAGEYAKLQQIGWLPARGDQSRGYRPEAIFTPFRDYLFSSQAKFLGLDRPVQNAASAFLTWLGLKNEPSPLQVVNHLLWCSRQGVPVNEEVYKYLNDHAPDPALLALRAQSCLLLDTGQYVSPGRVYWGQHPFGRWRHRLGEKFVAYRALLDRLDVKEGPGPYDAIDVLQDIAARHGGERAPLLAEDVPVVFECWKLLNQGLTTDEISDAELRGLANDEVVLDSAGWLRKPTEVFFQDPVITKWFSELGPRLIVRPEGWWQALSAAGVRGIGDAVETQVIELGDEVNNGLAERRLSERRRLLSRVLGVGESQLQARVTEFYSRVSVRSIRGLLVEQQLALGSRTYKSLPHEREALYIPHEGVLLCVERPDGLPSWAEVAREVARALGLEGDPHLASAIRDVLAPETDAAAVRDLDALGYLVVDQVAPAPVKEMVAEGFGAVTIDDPEAETDETIRPGEEDRDGSQGPGGTLLDEGTPRDRAAPPERALSSELVDETALAGLNLSTSPSDDMAPGAAATTSTGTDGSGEAAAGLGLSDSASTSAGNIEPANIAAPSAPSREDGKRPTPSAREAQTRLRSYVTHSAAALPSETGGYQDDAVELAGVKAVKKYERERGRVPEEMPPGHPGYDIRSTDSQETVRLIEVKATESRWGARGVALSSTQFRAAEDRRELFWLYVVEDALSDPRVWPIQDPASKVDQYFFDEGWQAVSDTSTPSAPPLAPLRLLQQPGHNTVPFFDLPELLEPNGAASGWLTCHDPEREADWFAVRITGDGLGLAYRGGVAWVEPLGRAPEDEELVLVVLRGQTDPDSGSEVTFRRWQPERDLAGNKLALRLRSDGSAEPLTVSDAAGLRVVGLVKGKARLSELET